MIDSVSYPRAREEFLEVLADVARAVDTDRRLPDWPFRAPRGNADVCQFSLAIEGPFAPVLQTLVDTHGDEAVSVVVLEPSPDYYREGYGSFPVFRSPGATIESMFYDLISYEPDGDPTGAAIFTANVVAIAGSSGSWAVWAERRWDLAIVLSQTSDGSWKSCGVPFVPVDQALAWFTEPDYKMPLPPDVRAEFLRNVRVRGTVAS